MRRVAVIGLDGAAPGLVFDRWRDDLPHLRALAERGLWGEMRSSHPPITVPAWASMMSGRDPGELGLYGFRNRRSYAYDDYLLASSRQVRCELVWDVLSRAGKKVIVHGVPQTYPPRPVNGCMVSGFLTPSRQRPYTYPADLRAEVERVAPDYAFDVEDFRTDDKAGLLQRIYRRTEQHFAVARHLLASRPWDFFMMVEIGVDRIHHGFWKYIDPLHPKYEAGNPFESSIRDYYRHVDGEVGALLDLLGAGTTVFVVSDHGARAMQGGICFNEWLIRRGDLVLHGRPAGPTPMSARLVDWRRTRAWAEGGYYGRLFLNVKGREPQGIVEPGDYERARGDLIAAIAAIEDAGGRCLGSRAYRPEDLYRQVNGIAPDLIVYFGDLAWRSIGSVGLGTIHTFENDIGPDDANHDWQGIFIRGEGGREGGGSRVGELQLMDMAPTILDELGVPPPAGMRGRIVVAPGRV